MPTACHGSLRNNRLSVPGRRVFMRDVVPLTNACGCHNSSLMDFSQSGAEAPLLLSLTLVGRMIMIDVPDS